MKSKGVTTNTTYITSAIIFQKLLSFIYFWYISNTLFAFDLGKYIFALSFTTLFSVFTDLGLAQVLTRESAKNEQRSNEYLKNIFGLKILLVIVTIFAIAIFINISGKSEIGYLIYLATIIMTFDTFTITCWSAVRAFRNLKYESIATVLVQIIILVIGVTSLKLSGKIVYLMLALIAASAFNLTFSLVIVKKKLGFSLLPAWDKKIMKYLLRIIPAFAVSGIFVKIYNAADAVLLGYLATEATLGFYAIPAKVITALTQILPGAFATAIFPVFSKYWLTSKEKLSKMFYNSLSYVIVISLPMTFGLVALLPEVLKNFWPSYRSILQTFTIMAFALPFLFISFPTGYLLNACNRQRNNAINRGIMAVVSIVLNIILIPKYSYLGAGMAFLLTQILVVILDCMSVRGLVEKGAVKNVMVTAVRSVFSCFTMLVFLYSVKQHMNLLPVVSFGAITYFIVLFLVGGMPVKELKKLFLDKSLSQK